MKHLMISAGTLVVLLLNLTVVTPAHALDNVSGECLDQVYNRISHEERVYRSVLYGQQKSADLPQSSVRYDKDYDAWMKVGNNQWRSPKHAGLTWSDILMDQQADVPLRRGLFEMRKTPTSDLIPPLLQSMRALQCRLRAVCAAAQKSQSATTATVEVQTDGCLEFELPVMTACKNTSITQSSPGSCDTVVDGLLERESKLLETVVAYDAAYRTLAQFSGTFEGFLADFRFPLLQPLWQMVRTLGYFDNLPCFTAQCDQ